jgi:hypothetical protein
LIGGLVLAGGGSVIAASGGSSSHQSAAKAQYCPNGQPPKPGKKCKKPKKPKKHKTQFHVHRKPAKRCYSGPFKLDVRVANKPKGKKTRVYRDGHRIKTTGRNHFTVKINPRHLRRGVHTLKLRVRRNDGKWRVRTIKFRRC